MLKTSIIMAMGNNAPKDDPPPPNRNIGYNWQWFESRFPIEGQMGSAGIPRSAEFEYQISGYRNPGQPRDQHGPEFLLEVDVPYQWVPHLASLSARVNMGAVTNPVSTLITDEFVANWVNYDTFQEFKNPKDPDGYSNLTNALASMPMAGFRSGQPGARELYWDNEGLGKNFPRRRFPSLRNACDAKETDFWALVLSHNIDDEHQGAWVAEIEWRLEQV